MGFREEHEKQKKKNLSEIDKKQVEEDASSTTPKTAAPVEAHNQSVQPPKSEGPRNKSLGWLVTALLSTFNPVVQADKWPYAGLNALSFEHHDSCKPPALAGGG